MSAPSKSNIPTPMTASQSKDWMKVVTLELNTGTDDETEVVVVNQGERKRRKQVRLAEQERQHREREEAECKAKEEAKRKAAEERRVREEAARARMAAERVWAESEAEQAQIEAEQKRVAKEEAAKKRAAEVAAKQQELVTDTSKKRVREEAGPSGSREAEAGGTRACCVHCAKARAKCERSGGKRQRVCNRCTGLKEKCEWSEVGGTRVGKGKGKEPEKPVIALPRSGKKCKRTKKAAAKDNNDNNEIKEVAGPSKGKGKERVRSGSGDNNQIVQGLDQLVVAVEKLTKGVRIMTAAHKSVAQSVYCTGVITEQILHKYKLFLALESKGEEWESEEEVNRVEVEAEVEELGCKMVEAGDPGLPKKKESVQKGPAIDDSGEGFDGK
ncbi:hypothetical protein SCLCIDRAFT_20460 [Scleroderma citrinum Foug A]|uniref:Zn(2)-C6 fungal-type domain-containing protein n=1 Tax=Scleroderma citrinum Foug A TaxID=1036808 RepID=A0A0C3EK16_9AGAM|nr:hypothetical protein SCLCIDRAFT_20460 [Scleroderma citrinum Foug A]